MTLIDRSMSQIDPPAAYAAALDAVRWRASVDELFVQEIFRRAERSFGFRYLAWVEWRDADQVVQGHSCHRVTGLDAHVVESVEAAIALSTLVAASCGLEFAQEWRSIF